MAGPHGIARNDALGRALLNADTAVRKPQGLREATTPYVAAIEEDRLPQEAPNPFEVGKAVLIPLGHEQQAVGALKDSVGILVEHDTIAEQLTATLECHRIGGPYLGPAREKPFDDIERGRLAHIVSPGLERETPDRKDLAVEIFPKLALHPAHKNSFLRLIDLQRGSNRAQVHTTAFAEMERSFGKQDPPKPVPGNKNELPILESAEMPWRTCSAFAPIFSQRAAISFMNEMRVASMALDAYFVSSALAASMTRMRSSRRMNGA
jgi:hypothetical protein